MGGDVAGCGGGGGDGGGGKAANMVTGAKTCGGGGGKGGCAACRPLDELGNAGKFCTAAAS